MTIRQKTIEVPFETNTANLATNTTLGTATRHDFAAVTVYIPETTSRTFRSVVVQVSFRDVFTTALDVTAWRIGIKLAAVAFTDTDVTQTLTNTGDHSSHMFYVDVTSYFTSNFGSGASQTSQVGVAVASSGASNITNITAKLIITYDYDDSGQDTRVKTIRIPLDSPTAVLTNTLTEIGTNQVPDLDALLPEASKTYRHIWFEIYANDAGGATTDFNLELALDAEGASTRAVMEQAQNTAVFYYDIWVRNDLDTTAAHAFKARSTLTSRFSGFGILLCVTYEYSHTSSSTLFNSLLLPFSTEPGWVPQSSGTNNFKNFTIWIEEPTTITLVQSGAMFLFTNPAGTTINVLFGAQTTRAYVLTAGSAQAGSNAFSHRFDSGSAGGSALTPARGENTLSLNWYSSADAASFGGMIYFNYTSGKATNGDGTHNHSVMFFLQSVDHAGGRFKDSSSLAPNLPEAAYWVNWLGFILNQAAPYSTSDSCGLQASRESGEGPADGWEDIGMVSIHAESEMSSYLVAFSTDVFKKNPGDPDAKKLALETARTWRAWSSQGTARHSFYMWYTYHVITQTRSHTLGGYAGDGSGITAVAHRLSNHQPVATAVSAAGGGYSFTWYDDTEALYETAREDADHVGRSDNLTS
jgi:hypothetical protein